MTIVVMDILDLVASASADDLAWGSKICEQTGHGPGTIYPALDRMLKAGLIEDRWEQPPPEDRPPRRYYTITSAGRAAYQEAVTARAGRRLTWATRGADAGGAA